MVVQNMETDQYEPPLDLEAYAANYTSHAKVDRLLFIAEKATGTSLELDALRLAADEFRKVDYGDTARYHKTIEKINGRLGQGYSLNREWIEQTDRRAHQKQNKLEAELNGYKTNLVKESIRMGHNDLGDFFYERGDLQSAFKSYVRTRDYCTAPKHIIHMCLNVIKVSVELGNFVHVSNYVQKAEQTPEIQKDVVTSSKLRCASGLAAIETNRHKVAAKKFAEVSAELGQQYSDVISPQDVAVYGSLCALATFDRSELKQKIIDNIQFREFLELVPEVREIVNDFYASKYATCLSRLDRLQPALLLDLHLHDHVQFLYKAIRSRALVQYTTPFTSVNLTTMAAAFNTDVSGLERELAALIMAGDIAARIDSHNKVLYARYHDTRTATFGKAIDTVESYLCNTKALMLRANLLRHDFVQKGVQSERRARPQTDRNG